MEGSIGFTGTLSGSIASGGGGTTSPGKPGATIKISDN